MLKRLSRVLSSLLMVGALTACTNHQVNPIPASQDAVPAADHDRLLMSPPSFWDTEVVYPFPVQLAEIADSQHQRWTIAYSDRYQGLRPAAEAPVIVFVHGRGTTMASFERVMLDCLEAGMRVIGVDLPHYGRSLPGNLHLPVNRSLADTRELMHRLTNDVLGVERAHWVGHSLGGQWVLGYALAYPAEVASVTAIASYGLESFPASVWRRDGSKLPLFDPGLQTDWARWLKVWEPLGHLHSEQHLSESAIEARYQPATGPEAAFQAATRKAMQHGNPREYQRYVETMVWDLYSLGIEVSQSDPQSLVQQLPEVAAPVLLLFGDQDRYLPVTRLSGHTDLLREVVAPLHAHMASKGNPPQVVVYAGAGHAPHIGQASQVADDVIAFVYRQRPRSALTPIPQPDRASSRSSGRQ